MPFHRSFLWVVPVSVLLTLMVVLGWDSIGCIAGLHTRRSSDVSCRSSTASGETAQPWNRDSPPPPPPPASPAGDEKPLTVGHASTEGGHVQRVAVDRVSAEQPNVSFVEALVPTLTELSEEAWAEAPVPAGLLYFIEIRTSKLISLAQLIRADPSLSSEDRRRLMQRLVVNYHAVTRVGDKLCGAIDDYVDHVAARAATAEVAGAHENVDGAQLDRQHGHDWADVFLQRQYREALEGAQEAVLADLVGRNAGWRDAVRVCRVLHSKLDHFMPIINALLNNGAASLL